EFDLAAGGAMAAIGEGEEGVVSLEEGAVAGVSAGRLMLFSRSGKAVRFRTADVRRTGRVARGVRGMRLKGDDRVIALAMVPPGSGCQVLTITEKGYGKRTAETLFPTKGRGTQGVIGMLTGSRNGPVVEALTVWPGDQVMLITDQGMVLRTGVDAIRQTGRNTQGVRVLQVAEGERVASVARIAEAEDGGGVAPGEEGLVGDGSAGAGFAEEGLAGDGLSHGDDEGSTGGDEGLVDGSEGSTGGDEGLADDGGE
ncbi:MAG: hypothetical protein HQL57_09185, partial [Magnetococcales bacterium]|nr:hypothetical protein [Magnetococcales bacterium]